MSPVKPSNIGFRHNLLSKILNNSTSFIPLLLATGVALGASSNFANAQQAWDPDAALGIQGGTGTWDAGSTNWTTDGGATNDVYDAGPPAPEAVFGGAGGTINVSGGQGITDLTFNVDGYTISGDQLAIDDSGSTISVGGADTATISNSLNNLGPGSASLTKTGTGTLVLNGANSYSGSTTISSGTLQLSSATGTIADVSDVIISGGTLDVDATDTVASITINGATAILDASGAALTATGDLTQSNGIIAAGSTINASSYLLSDGTNSGTVNADVAGQTGGSLGTVNAPIVVSAIGGTITDLGLDGITSSNATANGISVIETGMAAAINNTTGNGIGLTNTTGGNVLVTLANNVQGSDDGINISSAGGGTVTVDGVGNVTGGSDVGDDGIDITADGAVTVQNIGNVIGDPGIVINSGGADILLDNVGNVTGTAADAALLTSGGGAITVTNNGNFSGQTDGIEANSGAGNISIQGNGTIAGTDEDGIEVVAAGGDINIGDITANGSITGGANGVNATTTLTGTITVTTGDTVTAGTGAAIITSAQNGLTDINVNDALDGNRGVFATSSGSGNIDIDQAAVAITGVQDAIDAFSDGGTGNINIDTVAGSSASSSQAGSQTISGLIQNAASAGTVTINSLGTVTNTGNNGIGILGQTNGTGDVTITAEVVNATGSNSTGIASTINVAVGSASGNISITQNDIIDASAVGINATNQGNGTIVVTQNTTIGGTIEPMAVGIGTNSSSTGTGGLTTINLNGTTNSAGIGVDANSAGTDADIVINVNSTAAVDATGGQQGIAATTTGGAGSTIRIAGPVGGTVVGGTDGIDADTDGAAIAVSNLASATGNNGDGINANSTNGAATTGGAISVTSVGTVLGTNGNGIVADSGTGTTTGGNIDIQDTGTVGGIEGTNGDGVNANAVGTTAGGNIGIGNTTANGNILGEDDGVEAETSGLGTITVTATNDITGDTDNDGTGGGVVSETVAGLNTVNGIGAISGADFGITATSTGGGNIDVLGTGTTSSDDVGSTTINAVATGGNGTVTVNRTGAITNTGTGATTGINATSVGSGNITVTNTGGVTIDSDPSLANAPDLGDGLATTSTGSTAIRATKNDPTTTANVVVNGAGAIINDGTAASNGIVASNASDGIVDIDSDGAISLNDASTGDGINAASTGGGNVTVDNAGAINGGGTGINASSNGDGTVTVTTGADIGTGDSAFSMGGGSVTNTGIETNSVDGQNRIDLAHSITSDAIGIDGNVTGTGLLDINQTLGTITAGTIGIDTDHNGNSGDTDIDITNGTIDAVAQAITSDADNAGNINIDIAAPVTIDETTDNTIDTAADTGVTTLNFSNALIESTTADAVEASSGTGDIDITVSAATTLLGAPDALDIDSTSGEVTVVNDGTIGVTGGTPRGLIQIDTTDIANSTFTNNGTWFAQGGTSNIDTNVINNGAINAQNLATTDLINIDGNLTNIGSINLNDGGVGDVVDVAGNFTGGGTLNVDVDLSQPAAGPARADTLSVGGTTTTPTTVTFNVLPGGGAFLVDPIVIVDVGTAGGSSAGDFTGSIASIGAVDYLFEQVGDDFVITSTLDASIAASALGAPASAINSANAAFTTSSRIVITSSTQERSENENYGGFWTRVVGGQFDATNVGQFAGVQNFTSESSSSFSGVQSGFDIARFDIDGTGYTGHLGITGGILQGNSDSSNGGISFDVPFFGAYASISNDDFFFDATIRRDFYETDINIFDDFGGAFVDTQAEGTGVTGHLSAGSFFSLGEFDFTLSGDLFYSAIELDDFNAAPGSGFETIQTDTIESLIGKGSISVSRTFVNEEQTQAFIPFAQAGVQRDFEETITSSISQVSGDVLSGVVEKFGTEFTVGGGASFVDIESDVSLNFRGEARIGDRIDGYTFTAAIRKNF